MTDLADSTDFRFYKARYHSELTGKKATDIYEFLAVIKEIDESAIFDHIYHALLDYHFLPLEYPNDFAYWIADVLHEPALAERLANLDLRKLHDLEMVRQEIIRVIEDYLATHDAVSSKAGIGQEFYFIRCISVIFPTRYVASDIKEMLVILKEIDPETIFYYFIASRLLDGGHYKKWSDWVHANDSHELMEKLDDLYPYGFASMEAMRTEIVKIVEEYLWEHL